MAKTARKLRLPASIFVLLLAGLALLAGGLLTRDAAIDQEGRPGTPAVQSKAEVQTFWFYSQVLDREMPLRVFLPPGYASGDRHYPVLYMLHGLDPRVTQNWEWEQYGMFWQADNMMTSGELAPFIIALPQGEQGYWIDQDGGPAWSKYVAQDVVGAMDARYRTVPDAGSRAIGGLSMGADGALQVAMTNPGVFSVVGMHSPALRQEEFAAAYYGDANHFNAYYPPTQIQQRPEQARQLKIELDSGDSDWWLPNAEALHAEFDELGIAHVWNRWPGEHDGYYWGDHIPDYLRFYSWGLGISG